MVPLMRGTSVLDAQALRRARERAGLTQHELARRVGVVGAGRVSRWEVGGVTPRPETLRRLAEVLGVEATDLLVPMDGGTDFRRLRVLCAQRPQAFAGAMHMSSATLLRWETGRIERMPSDAVAEQAARQLGVTADEVLGALARSRALRRRSVDG